MEKLLIKNCFMSPVESSPGVDYSDDLVIETELVDRVVKGPSGEDTDFVLVREPIEVNRYHLNKVIQERAKGCDLESIVARCERTGDPSLLNARSFSYGDGYLQPQSASDLYEEGVRTSEFLDSLSAADKELYIKLAKLPEDKLKAYIESLKKPTTESTKEEKTDGDK